MAVRMMFSTVRFVQMASRRFAHTEVMHLSQELKDVYYPKLGNRDIVCYGINGHATYVDRAEFPCPAIRFGENTAATLALRAKESGDWKTLSLADKRALYRASFRQTYSEFNAPTGEWKGIVGMLLLAFSATGWIFYWLHHSVLPPLPETITREWQEKQLEHMIKIRQNSVEGVASLWDYETNQWK